MLQQAAAMSFSRNVPDRNPTERHYQLLKTERATDGQQQIKHLQVET